MSYLLTLILLVSVGQILCQIEPSAGATSLVGVITGGASNENPVPTRWIEFNDRENRWSTLGNSFTVEAWVWHSSKGTADWQPVVSRHPGMNQPRFNEHFSISIKESSTVEVRAGCGCSVNATDCGYGYVLSGNITVEEWTHIAVSFDGDGTSELPVTQTAILYINGEEKDSSTWGQDNTQCQGRAGLWSKYSDVKVGYYDDDAADEANIGNPSLIHGWWGRIDEIRFWTGVRSMEKVQEYHNVGLKGSEAWLFAYYTFTPEQQVLDDTEAYKYIMNSVGDYLHGLPYPNPSDGAVYQQPTGGYQINIYSTVFGQSDQDPELPVIQNSVTFQSYPNDDTVFFTVIPGSYSPALQTLIDDGVAQVYGNPEDLSYVTVVVTCPENDCSDYTTNWKDYYLDYSATYDTNPTPSSRVYLRITTSCPSGTFDECGTCEGDNSLCQCVVYHSFESERMSYVLLQWSLTNLYEEVSAALGTIESTMKVLDMTTTPNDVLRAQISDITSFYNGDLTNYCGELSDFISELEASIPTGPESMTNVGSSAMVDGTLPHIPNYYEL